MPTTYDQKLKNLQYRTRLLEWLQLGAGLLLLGILIVVWQVVEQHSIREREYSRLSTQSGIIYNDLRRQLMGIRASHVNLQAELLTGNGDFETVRPFVDKRMRAFVQTLTGVRTMTLLNADGEILVSSDPDQQSGSLAEHVLVQRVIGEQGAGILYVSRPYALNHGLLTVCVASILTDRQGNFSGMIMTELSPLEMGKLLKSVFYVDDMQAAIAHANGTLFVAEPGQGQASPASNRPMSKLVERHLKRGRDISLQDGSFAGEPTTARHITVLQTIKPDELNTSDALVVVISRDLAQVLSVLNVERRVIAALYLVLVGVTILAMLRWQRRTHRVFLELHEAQGQVLLSHAELLKVNRQLEQQTENMRSLAFLDELTGIANRRHFNRSLEAEWRRCQREQQPLSLILLDVDYFKQFNDHYGHQSGDDCLECIAGSLKNSLTRSHDLPARIGGEEFACLLPNTPLEGALIKAERIRAEIEALQIPHAGSSTLPVVTVSVGVASVKPTAESSYTALLKAADDALYLAKNSGRNRVCQEFDCLPKSV